MTSRIFLFHPDAKADMLDIWRLVCRRDGDTRADALCERIEAFCRRLAYFAVMGTKHDDVRPGLRSVGIPGLRRVSILFLVQPERLTIIRIGYLGRNVWEGLRF